MAQVARHDHARAEAQARQEHLHLARRRILRLVENHEGVLQRASAHVGERRNLNDALGEELLIGVKAEDVVQRIVKRAQVRIDLLLQIAGQKAQPLARLDSGTREHDLFHQPRTKRRHRHDDGEVRLSRACRSNAERDGIFANGVEVDALTERFRAHMTATARHEDRVAEKAVQRLTLAALDESHTVAHLMHRERRALPVQVLQLAHDLRRRPHDLRLAIDRKLLAAAYEAAVEIVHEHLQVLVVLAEKRRRLALIGKGDLLLQNLLQRKTPLF